jgi:hypothetical protein
MSIYRLKWSVPVPGHARYEVIDRELTFKRKAAAEIAYEELLNAYEMIGIPEAGSYIKLSREEVI